MNHTDLHHEVVRRIQAHAYACGLTEHKTDGQYAPLGLIHPNALPQWVLNGADEASVRLQSQVLGTVLHLPGNDTPDSKIAMVAEALEDLDTPGRVFVLTWTDTPADVLVQNLLMRLARPAPMPACVFFMGDKAGLPEAFQNAIEDWVTIES